MVRYGYTLFSELNGPRALVDQAVAAERAGFDFAVVSDHFHPWLSSHSDSPFAWSVLGAVAERTDRLELMTYVTCPFLRYHPAIIAQAAATVQMLTEGRFVLGLGSGENLNEHVVGRGWPPVDVRHEMLAESVEAIRALWGGGVVAYRGRHVTVEDARLYTRPETPPPIAVAVSGPRSVQVAVEHADAVIAVEPDADLVGRFGDARGGDVRAIGQQPIAWDTDAGRARKASMRFAFGAPGWKVMAELPNVVNFDAAAALVTEDDIAELVPASDDPEPFAAAVAAYVDAGFEEVCVVQCGDDRGADFFSWWAQELRPLLP